MYPVTESYSWLYPNMTVNDAPGEKVIIRGPALFSYEKHFSKGISKNMRKYVQDEIVRSARTLKGVVIDVNHEISIWEENKRKGLSVGPKPSGKGHVMCSEEEDGQIEYVGEINDKIYAAKARDTNKVRKGILTEQDYYEKWRKKPLLGVSVDADFHFLRCSVCGEDFTEPNEYEHHMRSVEKKGKFEWEPHLIYFKRLSLVEPPEQLGVIGAGFEVLETYQRDISRLLETVINFKQKQEEEKYKMSKIALRTETGHVAIGKSTVKGIVEQEEEPEQKQEEHKCGEDEHWDEEKQACVKNEQAEQPAATEKFQLGEPCSAELKACVDKLIADGKSEESAWAICKNQLGETVKLRESKIGAVVWKPIEFASFDATLKETKDEIRAAQVVKQNREINESFGMVALALNEVIEEVNKPLTVKQPFIDDSWRAQVKQLAEVYQKLAEHIQKLPKDDLGWKAIKPYDDAEVKQKLDEVTQKIPKLEETITQQKKDFDNLLDSADKSVKEYFATNKKEMQEKDEKIKQLEQKLSEAEKQKLQETEKLETRVENLEDKLQPQFKSIAQKAEKEKKQSPDLSYKPGGK